MSTNITIGTQIISFPTSGDSPDWGTAIVQFAQAVSSQLVANGGTAYDVSTQSFTIDSYNSASNVDIPALTFPTSTVRAIFINYSVYRATSSANADEAGDIIAIYNPNNGSGLKWTLTQGNRTGLGAQTSFNVTDTGQVQFSTTALSGTGHAGKITFYARALTQ